MAYDNFIVIGENIHCSRIAKVNGKFVKQARDGNWNLEYITPAGPRSMPIPPALQETPDWQAGKLRHCVAAAWQGTQGNPDEQTAAAEYIKHLAGRQAETGAAYLDVNVDEFSPDIEARCRAMRWLAETAQNACDLPLSIDSSHTDVLEAGLQTCKGKHPPMLNSVSLERIEAVDLAVKHKAHVIAGAAGKDGIPSTADKRVANLEELVNHLTKAGVTMESIFLDPLVLPVATDAGNPGVTLETIVQLRNLFDTELHVTGGFSNVSFGMPERHLINLVFTHMAIAAGADSGIVDPLQINVPALRNLKPEGSGIQLARNLLAGKDDFGMEFIKACREGLAS